MKDALLETFPHLHQRITGIPQVRSNKVPQVRSEKVPQVRRKKVPQVRRKDRGTSTEEEVRLVQGQIMDKGTHTGTATVRLMVWVHVKAREDMIWVRSWRREGPGTDKGTGTEEGRYRYLLRYRYRGGKVRGLIKVQIRRREGTETVKGMYRYGGGKVR